MSNKIIWAVVVIVVVAGVLWYAGLIPSMSQPAAEQSAATVNAGQAPATLQVFNALTSASANLTAAGKDEAKVKAAVASVQAAIASLTALHGQLKLAVQVSAGKNNDMGKANAALIDYAQRLSAITAAPINATNSAVIAAHLTAIGADISTINTALAGAKFK